jgi:hypothetical protein
VACRAPVIYLEKAGPGVRRAVVSSAGGIGR